MVWNVYVAQLAYDLTTLRDCHSRHMLRYAFGSSARVVNIRTLITQMGLVSIAVTAPSQTQ
jgi:hypothetical protein